MSHFRSQPRNWTIYLHTINIEHLPVTEKSASHLLKRQKKSLRAPFIVLSVLAHSVFVVLILGKLNFYEATEQTATPIDGTKSTKIQSYLFIPLPKTGQSEEKIEQISQAEDAVIKEREKAASDNAEQAIEYIPEELPPIISEALPKREDSQISTTLESANNETTEEAAPSALSKYGARDNIRQQLQNIESNKLNALAQSASREYSTSLISPAIDAPVYSSEYMYSKEPGVHMITCEDSIQTKLKLLSGLMGGKIKCREKDFQKYIDKYLKKEGEINIRNDQ